MPPEYGPDFEIQFSNWSGQELPSSTRRNMMRLAERRQLWRKGLQRKGTALPKIWAKSPRGWQKSWILYENDFFICFSLFVFCFWIWRIMFFNVFCQKLVHENNVGDSSFCILFFEIFIFLWYFGKIIEEATTDRKFMKIRTEWGFERNIAKTYKIMKIDEKLKNWRKFRNAEDVPLPDVATLQLPIIGIPPVLARASPWNLCRVAPDAETSIQLR